MVAADGMGGALLVVLLACLSLLGCWAVGSDVDDVEEVSEEFVEAIANRDAQAVCDSVSQRSRSRIVSESSGPGRTCRSALGASFSQAPIQDFALQPKLGKPMVSEERATVIITSPALRRAGQRYVLRLVKEDETWSVDLGASGSQPPD